jgi:bacillithiol biosynthesis cysteine-adding enzyme BshC
VTVDVDENSANLFYQLNGQRVLLERDKEGNFRGKGNECLLTESELLDVAEYSPERLSNNVITRPLMQELLFPNLAFIAGPGEIAYWSTLKGAFSVAGRKMPPLVPRLNITLLDRTTEKWLAEHGLSVRDVMTGKLQQAKKEWLERQKTWDLDGAAASVKEEIDQVHARLRELGARVDPALESLGEKNKGYLFNQIDYFTRQIERSFEERHDRTLKKFDRIEACLFPKQGPQERVWNVFPILNHYGIDLVAQLADQSFAFNGTHKILSL